MEYRAQHVGWVKTFRYEKLCLCRLSTVGPGCGTEAPRQTEVAPSRRPEDLAGTALQRSSRYRRPSVARRLCPVEPAWRSKCRRRFRRALDRPTCRCRDSSRDARHRSQRAARRRYSLEAARKGTQRRRGPPGDPGKSRPDSRVGHRLSRRPSGSPRNVHPWSGQQGSSIRRNSPRSRTKRHRCSWQRERLPEPCHERDGCSWLLLTVSSTFPTRTINSRSSEQAKQFQGSQQADNSLTIMPVEARKARQRVGRISRSGPRARAARAVDLTFVRVLPRVLSTNVKSTALCSYRC